MLQGIGTPSCHPSPYPLHYRPINVAREKTCMSQAELRVYLKEIEQARQMGNATEHSYRSYLKHLLEAFAPGVTATNEPKRVKCGAPDFIITRKQTPLGYIETKDIGVS